MPECISVCPEYRLTSLELALNVLMQPYERHYDLTMFFCFLWVKMMPHLCRFSTSAPLWFCISGKGQAAEKLHSGTLHPLQAFFTMTAWFAQGWSFDI